MDNKHSADLQLDAAQLKLILKKCWLDTGGILIKLISSIKS